jgi:hypothetical protein
VQDVRASWSAEASGVFDVWASEDSVSFDEVPVSREDELRTAYETGEWPRRILAVPLLTAPHVQGKPGLGASAPLTRTAEVRFELMSSGKVLVRLPECARETGRLMLSVDLLAGVGEEFRR